MNKVQKLINDKPLDSAFSVLGEDGNVYISDLVLQFSIRMLRPNARACGTLPARLTRDWYHRLF
jgi:hypothetical protein